MRRSPGDAVHIGGLRTELEIDFAAQDELIREHARHRGMR
jgi:hypothetical protein